MKKQFKYLILHIAIIIFVTFFLTGYVVYATGFGSELANIEDEISAASPYTTLFAHHGGGQYTAQTIIDDINGRLDDSYNGHKAEELFEEMLSKYANAYCGRHKKGMSSHTALPTFQPPHGTAVNVNNYITFDGYGDASISTIQNGFHDANGNAHADTDSFTTTSNFVAINEGSYNIKSISTGFVNATGNVIGYAVAYSDKVDGSIYYTTNAQRSIWGVVGADCSGCWEHPNPTTSYSLYLAGKAIDEYEEMVSRFVPKGQSDNPTVSLKESDNPGTVLLDSQDTYRIGPFHMSDYVYAYSEYVKQYSGADVTANGKNYPGIIAGLVDGKVYLTTDSGTSIGELTINGSTTKIVYEDWYGQATNMGDTNDYGTYTQPIPQNEAIYPYPNSTFYIDISRSVISKDAEKDGLTLKDVEFTYRTTNVYGTTEIIMVRGVSTTWKRSGSASNDAKVLCSCEVNGGSCNCTDDEGEPDCNCTEWYCTHEHKDCIASVWTGEGIRIESQPMLVPEATVEVKEKVITNTFNLRMTTDILIKKFVREIKHETNDYVTFGDVNSTSVRNSTEDPYDRMKMTDLEKEQKPVFAEYGDIIKFQIYIENRQNKDIKIKIKDILPDKIQVYERIDNTNGGEWKDNDWIEVKGKSSTMLYLILRTDANDDNLYCNTVKLITKNNSITKDNDENVDFNRTTDKYVGPVVNISELETPEDIISKEYYKINDYNVTIDKYISAYNHEMMTKNNDNLITSESYKLENRYEENDVKGAIVPDSKKNNYPVPVEKTETLEYTLRLTNYSENYNDTGIISEENKVATEIRPTKVIDELNKGLEFVKENGKYVITGKIYGNGEVGDIDLVLDTDFTIEQKDNTITINLKDQNSNGDYLVIQPGGYLLYTIKVKVVESNMNLDKLENIGKISVLTNINNGKDRTGDKVECPDCQGIKQIYTYNTCSKCNGSGKISSADTICSTCKGLGKTITIEDCTSCSGSGKTIKSGYEHQKVYQCKKCNMIYDSIPSVCESYIIKTCGGTSFRKVCTICGSTGGATCLKNHGIYKITCTSGHTYEKSYANRNDTCPELITCSEKNTTASISYTYTYKCPDGHTIDKTTEQTNLKCNESVTGGKCGKDMTLYKVKSACNQTNCGWSVTKEVKSTDPVGTVYKETTCQSTTKKFTCGKKAATKVAWCTNSTTGTTANHLTSECESKHFVYKCTKCDAEYDTKPTSCTASVYKKCNNSGSSNFDHIELSKVDATVIGLHDDTEAIQKLFEKYFKNCSTCKGLGKVKKETDCTACSGTGRRPGNITCSECEGTGHDLDPNETVVPHTCAKCSGTGKIDNTDKNADGKTERIVRTADGTLNRNNTIVKDTRQNRDTDQDGNDEVSKDYVRMKDLVIAGYVWLDMNRDGIMNDEDGSFITDQTKAYYNIGDDTTKAGKQSVVVNLYSVVGNATEGTLVRTTQTDDRGRYTFSNYYDGSNLQWYNDYKASCWEEYNDKNLANNKKPYERLCNEAPAQTPQRIDKATGKDEYGNYTAGSEFIKYYIEFEYDGIVYKSTEFYSGMDNLIIDKNASDYGEMTGIDDPPIYTADSNAAEFTDVREGFNAKYEYISYDIAYNDQKVAENNSRLDFDKTDHTSQLMENPNRIVTARSFIKLKTMGGDGADEITRSLSNTNTLWLFNHDDYTTQGTNHQTPDTEYLKYINLGLELREDVDITLTKDVYSVTTLINGEEMEYFFNQNNTFNGETGTNGTGLYLNDFIVKTPYGLDLYESDYKMRVDQYSSSTVKAYKGLTGESELNTEVTYRITVANKAINDDESINGQNTTDTKLKVKVSEILDLYDENFKKYTSDADVVPVKRKDENGYLVDSTIKVAEAWYFEKATDGEYIVGDGEFSSNYANENGELIQKPVFVKADSTDIGNETRYKKVYLTLSNTSSLGDGNSNKENANNFETDGYYTLYISGMEGLELSEGQNFDIYVKYVLDKADSETTITTEDYTDTIKDTATTTDGAIVNIAGTSKGSSTTLKRTLKILDRITKDASTARGLEGIAQVNLYSVWYEEDKDGNSKPASLVDMDSNAGNIGNVNSNLQSALQGKTDTTERIGILDAARADKANNKTSADTWNPYYEDMTYKTGIQITADGSEWTKEQAKELHGEIELQSEKMIRELTGRVWDDSRTETIGDSGDSKNKQYLANGIYSNTDRKQEDALDNENVPQSYKNEQAAKESANKTTPDEEQDIKVRNVKAELIEIVEIPQGNGKSHYYEEILGNVTWEQAQHIRTNANGDYTLTGFIPGKYIVRFTYGDTVVESDLTSAEKNYAEDTIDFAVTDMQIFNGQDYKTTKYAYDLSTDYSTGATSVDPTNTSEVAELPVKEGTIDQYAAGMLSASDGVSNNDVVMLALERPDLSDARDDEIRRLEVNDYSEIMINQKAEILKGLANNSPLSTQSIGDDVSVNYYEKYGEEKYQSYMQQNLTALTDATNMNAETVEFLVKPEKLTYEQTNTNTYYTKLSLKDYYYDDLDTIINEVITERAYKIENIDMGIEYRPETNISLTKEIDQILLVTSDNEVLANLKLYTETKMEDGVEKVTHHVDMANSTGADKVQFISNTYEVDKLLEGIVNIYEERQQGFLYVAVDEEILQGCKVIVQYKFIAQNNSEIDRVSNKLNSIRFYANKATQELAANYLDSAVLKPIYDEAGNALGTEYTANNFAKNMTYSDVYASDGQSIYRNRPKTMVEDSVNSSRGSDGYFGDYVGYTYYIGRDEHNLDTIAEMKFDRIIDYVDTDLEYVQLDDDEGRMLDTEGKTIISNPEEAEQTSLLPKSSITSQSAQNTKLLSSTSLEGVMQNEIDDTTATNTPEDKADTSIEEEAETEDKAESSSTGNTNTSSGMTSVLDGTSDISTNTNKYWVSVTPKITTITGGDTSSGNISSNLPISITGQERLFAIQMMERIFRLGAPWAEEVHQAMNLVASKDGDLDQNDVTEISTAIFDILTDMRGIQYKSLVMTVADKESDDQTNNINSEFSKFLVPRVVAEADEAFKNNDEKTDDSKAIIYLPVSKVLASEEDTENMLYENIAEVIQFTVLTGRRTNFDTTIGNADIHVVHDQNKSTTEVGANPYEKYGSIEFVTAALEKDTSSTETITLTPPTGLMKNRRAIFEAMETTRDVLKITVIAVAVVVIAIGITKFTMLKIKKRRYK